MAQHHFSNFSDSNSSATTLSPVASPRADSLLRPVADKNRSPAKSTIGAEKRKLTSGLLEKPLPLRATPRLPEDAVQTPPTTDRRPSLSASAGITRTRLVPRSTPTPRRPSEPVLVQPARSGDHPDIQQLLLNVFHAPSRDDFHAWSERPGYDPQQRLLVKHRDRLAAHTLVTDYVLQFGACELPVKQLHWLATFPSYQDRGFATALVRAAESRMRAEQTPLGVLRTKIPHFFARQGWAVCGRHSVSHGRAREVLARLSALPAGRLFPLSIRYWRHVELPALMRIYAQNLPQAYGAVVRGEEDWRWLISRKAFDHILVAIHGRDRMDLEDTRAPLTGYAIMRGQRVVELVTDPAYPTTAEQLLARACGEMIENDRQELAVEAAPGCEVHGYIADSGGQFNQSEADGGEALMVKILDFASLIARLGPEILSRAQAAGIKGPCELGFHFEGQKGQLVLNRKSVQWIPGKLGRAYLQLKTAELTRLLLGHGCVREAHAAGRISATTNAALQLAQTLFPPVPWWRPSWDELGA
ncbi:MAG: GNAT family N-acetyltransferase [Pirellulales bacterium]|nr:GNAT family N-acetyltransferase [Pirellulales bacterium]